MKVIVQNLAIEYTDEGSGPTILLLHGWGNTAHHFDTLCAELSGFRLVRLDLPGFGDSETPHHAWTVEEYARFVSAFCEKLHIQARMLIGHSFGGRIIIKGVGRNILSASKIVLIGSAGVANRRTFRNVMYAAIAKTGKFFLKPISTSLYARARQLLYSQSGSDYLATGNMSHTFLNVIREDLSDDASQVHVPTLLIWGTNDQVTPLSEGQRLHQLIQNSELRVIENAAHFVYKEKPIEVARIIREFLSL